VGNRLKRDDGVGPAICDLVQGRVLATVMDVGTAPENYLGPISRLAPAALLIMDAADSGAAPGTLSILPQDALGWPGCSTHAPSMKLLLSVLDRARQPWVHLLGIQPGELTLGEGLSPPVRRSADVVAEVLRELYGRPAGEQ
jgi:hydrogenase 3 maturation protease